MSNRRKLWWKNLRENNPKKYIEVCKNIGKASKNRIMPKGELSSGWKGGRYTTKRDGYVYIYAPENINAIKGGKGGGGYVLEHRLVMEKKLGRFLLKGEDVHHINGNKQDNRIKNLMLVTHNKHYKEHGCPNCGFKIYLK